MLIHQNYPYTEKNVDCWYRFAQEMESILQTREKDKEIYLISAEDTEDESWNSRKKVLESKM